MIPTLDYMHDLADSLIDLEARVQDEYAAATLDGVTMALLQIGSGLDDPTVQLDPGHVNRTIARAQRIINRSANLN
jgi:hypothetical protein